MKEEAIHFEIQQILQARSNVYNAACGYSPVEVLILPENRQTSYQESKYWGFLLEHFPRIRFTRKDNSFVVKTERADRADIDIHPLERYEACFLRYY